MNESVIKAATNRGFVQGIGWAIALLQQHPYDADGMLFESGLRLVDFLDACVGDEDLRRIKTAARIGGVWDRKRANNGDLDTIVPVPAPHKKHPGFHASTTREEIGEKK
jgi:hypothetical protein